MLGPSIVAAPAQANIPSGVDDPVADPPPEPGPIPIPRTRVAAMWMRVLPALLLLAVILIFVFENLRDVKVSFFTVSGTLPLAVVVLGSAGIGVLLVLALGTLRIFQLRKQIHQASKEQQSIES
jgi:uncharacterized integral membrane protein